MELLEDYTSWLSKESHAFPADEDWTQLVTPFLNFNNDNIEVYYRLLPNGNVEYADGKQTLRELEMAGLNRITKSRKKEFDKILNAYGINLVDEELTVIAPANKRESTLHRFIGATQEILDLRVLAKEKVQSFFLDDLQDLLLAHDIPTLRNPTFYGKSGLPNTFDFAVPRMGSRAEYLVRGLSNPRKDRVLSAILLIKDTLAKRADSRGMVVLNDEAGFSADLEQALTSYEIPYGKISDRLGIVRQLKAA